MGGKNRHGKLAGRTTRTAARMLLQMFILMVVCACYFIKLEEHFDQHDGKARMVLPTHNQPVGSSREEGRRQRKARDYLYLFYHLQRSCKFNKMDFFFSSSWLMVLWKVTSGEQQ